MVKSISLFFICTLFVLSCQQPTGDSNVVQIVGDKVSTENGKQIILDGLGKYGTTTFFLVRHAEKLEGDDPDLTDIGIERSKRLAEILKGVPINTVFSTDTKRTRATAIPSAEMLNLEIVNYSSENQGGLIESTLRYSPGDNYLIVGHSNTIPVLLNLFIGKEVYENIDGSVYNDLFVVVAKNGEDAQIYELKY